MAQASTMVSSSAPSVYSVQALVVLAEVQLCGFYFVYLVLLTTHDNLFNTLSYSADLGTTSGHGVPQ